MQQQHHMTSLQLSLRGLEVSDLEVVLAGVATDLRAATMAELLFSRLCSCCSSPPSCIIPCPCTQVLSKKLETHSYRESRIGPFATCFGVNSNVPSLTCGAQHEICKCCRHCFLEGASDTRAGKAICKINGTVHQYYLSRLTRLTTLVSTFIA